MLVDLLKHRVSCAIKLNVNIFKTVTFSFLPPTVWPEYPRGDAIPPKFTVIFHPCLFLLSVLSQTGRYLSSINYWKSSFDFVCSAFGRAIKSRDGASQNSGNADSHLEGIASSLSSCPPLNDGHFISWICFLFFRERWGNQPFRL
jgi:hypothetical protein